MLLARKSKRCLKYEAINVVIPLKIGLLFLLLFLIKVWHHICDLNVGESRIQVFGVHLDPDTHGIKDVIRF